MPRGFQGSPCLSCMGRSPCVGSHHVCVCLQSGRHKGVGALLAGTWGGSEDRGQVLMPRVSLPQDIRDTLRR